MLKAITTCMSTTSSIDVTKLVSMAKRYETERKIDSLSILKNQKLYIFHSQRDSTVKYQASEKLKEFYQRLDVKDIVFKSHPSAGHSMVTNDYGNSCSSSFENEKLLLFCF